MQDLDLAKRLIDGDEAASHEFFAEYFPRLYRFARLRLNGDEQAAEEVVQATLIRGVRKLHTFRGEAALFTWLCTLCRREIGAWLEQRGRTMEVSLDEERPAARMAIDAAVSLAGTNPETEAQRHEVSRFVRLTLDQLPERYGLALEWKYVEGLSVDEIAVRLGVGYKAAESVLTRARQAFREAFALMVGTWPFETSPTSRPSGGR